MMNDIFPAGIYRGPRKGLPLWGEEEQRSERGVVIFTAPMDAEFVTTKGVALRATELE